MHSMFIEISYGKVSLNRESSIIIEFYNIRCSVLEEARPLVSISTQSSNMRLALLRLSMRYLLLYQGSRDQAGLAIAAFVSEIGDIGWRYVAYHSEGCEGFTYKFRFDDSLVESDCVTVDNSKRVVFALGKDELGLVNGSTFDYIKEMMR